MRIPTTQTYKFHISLLIFILLGSSLAVGASQSLEMGKSAFDKGDFAAAFKLSQLQIQQPPGDPELNFLLGRSAFEIGDLESARNNFKRVLANHPPAAVQQNIERYLQLIDKAAQQHSISVSLTLGISYDDNVYTSPVDEQIDSQLDGTITLNGNSATPQDGLSSQNMLQLNHLYRSHPKRVGWLSSLLRYNSHYAAEDDLNINLIALKSGPLWQQNQRQFWL